MKARLVCTRGTHQNVERNLPLEEVCCFKDFASPASLFSSGRDLHLSPGGVCNLRRSGWQSVGPKRRRAIRALLLCFFSLCWGWFKGKPQGNHAFGAELRGYVKRHIFGQVTGARARERARE